MLCFDISKQVGGSSRLSRALKKKQPVHLVMLDIGVLILLRLEPRLDALVLLVKVRHVGDKVLLDIHVWQRIDLRRRRPLQENMHQPKKKQIR